jgi:SAM-dependent methyltransferase
MTTGALPRGGQPDAEIANAARLLAGGAGEMWGWETPAGHRRVDARIAWLAAALALRPGVRVLECGCGTGIFTTRLARFGIDLTAADIAAPLLHEAARRCEGQQVRFTETNLEDPHQIEDGAFDAICGVSVLHHLDTKRALPALWRKLRPGGRFAFSEPNLLNPINRFIVFTPDTARRQRLGVSSSEMAFTPQELRAEFERSGFTVFSVEHRDFLHPSTPAFLVPLVERLQAIAEATPGLRGISGSLWVSGCRPAAS